jgi:hypothetical protein
MKVALKNNEEWISFADNMFIDHRCLETYFNSPLSMLIQFTNLCCKWYISLNKYGEFSNLRRYIKVRDLIFEKNGYLSW